MFRGVNLLAKKKAWVLYLPLPSHVWSSRAGVSSTTVSDAAGYASLLNKSNSFAGTKLNIS